MNNILALDISTKYVGISYYSNGEFKHIETIKLAPLTTKNWRKDWTTKIKTDLIHLNKFFNFTFENYKIDQIVIEYNYFASSNHRGKDKLLLYTGIVLTNCLKGETQGIHFLTPSKWQPIVFNNYTAEERKGRENIKNISIKEANKVVDWVVTEDNEADSINMLRAFLKLQETRS